MNTCESTLKERVVKDFNYIKENYLKEKYDLYYVDYRDSFDDHPKTLQQCIEDNSLYPASEITWDMWECPSSYEEEEVAKEMRNNDESELYDAFQDEIRDWIYEHDTSDPTSDLLRNTSDQTMFYSLGVEVDGWHEAFLCAPWRGEREEEATMRINDILGIKEGTPDMEKLELVVAQASYGGELRIYFTSSIEDVISGGEEKRYWEAESKEDFQTIQFKGMFAVGVINTLNGSGDFEYLNIDLTLPFMRENLFISRAEKYSLENIFGMITHWCKSDSPTLSYEAPSTDITIEPSKNAAAIAQDQEYERVFKAGGCTYGDMDYRRHRDVKYINEVPCGSKCPHCGTFWVD